MAWKAFWISQCINLWYVSSPQHSQTTSIKGEGPSIKHACWSWAVIAGSCLFPCGVGVGCMMAHLSSKFGYQFDYISQ